MIKEKREKRKEKRKKKKEKIKVDFTKYIEYLNENTDITLRTFCRKFNLKKADSISILKSLECNNYQHKLIEELE